MNFLRRVFMLLQICTIILCTIVLVKFAIQYKTYAHYWGTDFQTLIESLNFNSLVSEYCFIDTFDGVIQEVIYNENEELIGFMFSSLTEDRSFNKSIFLADINDTTELIIDNIHGSREELFLRPEILKSQNAVYVEICSESLNIKIKNTILRLIITQSTEEDE